MKRLAFLALAVGAVCAVAFSPGYELLLGLAAVAVIGIPLAAFGHLPAIFTFEADDPLTGHGHMHSQADGPGALGRHGLLRSIIFVLILAVWALIIAACSRVGHAVSNFIISAGHIMARTNTSAQPLPS